MTLPRSAGDVLSDHVVFELESIDRMYCNLYVPQLQRAEGIVGFIRGYLGQPIASTSVIAPMSRDFVARLAAFAGEHDIPRIDFAKGDLPRAFRTADLRLIHAAICCSRYSSWTCCGVRY